MSGIKREIEKIDDLHSQAVDVALRAGAISECELHSGELIYEDDEDAEKQAYAIGTNMWKNGEVDGTREEFMDAIKSAFENASHDGCMSCDKLMRDD